MLLRGVKSPDKSRNGKAIRKHTNNACCIVVITDESRSPVPITASKKRLIPM
jgi:hypothetical protein